MPLRPTAEPPGILRLPGGRGLTFLYRTAQLRQIEDRAGAALAAGTLMARAGKSAAAWIDAWRAARVKAGEGLGAGRAILLLCGPGNNGGDGFACAAALRGLGHRCVCWAPQPSRTSDARGARARWESMGGAVAEMLPRPSEVALVVDALFGIGLARPLEEPFLGALRWTRENALPMLALDVPSGLDADTGNWVGGVAGVSSLATITFLGDKPGLHTLEGMDAAGHVTVAALDVQDAEAVLPGRLNGPDLFPAALAPRPANCNKGDFGSVAVVGGASGMVGAALLAGRAALRLGAGKVFVQCLADAAPAVDPQQPELMFRPVDGRGRSRLEAGVVVAGCGLGTGAESRECLRLALGHGGPLVLDADALNLLAAEPQLRDLLYLRGPEQTVLTPHPGEAGRLLDIDARAVQLDRVSRALSLAQGLECIVVLKGAGSVIALPSSLARSLGWPYVINPTGTGALASAGTGDVLAGMIGSLLAQIRGPDSAACAAQAVLAAVWLHGQAASDFGGDLGLVASDIAPLAAGTLSRLRAGRDGALSPAPPLGPPG
jgi:hydroxyethylthiazole kinase-like uncharacterized protein yjeF